METSSNTFRLSRPFTLLAIAVLALLGCGLFFFTPAPQSRDPIDVTWVIAHEPVSLFDEASKVLAEEFEKNADRPIRVKVLGPNDIGGKDNGVLSKAEVFEEIDSGRAQLSTLSVGALAQNYPEIRIINLPFLFEDYAQAEKVFDGDVGRKLLDGVTATMNVHALAFTFSGGFMVIESNKKTMGSADSLEGLRIATINGPVSQKTLKAFGAEAEPINAFNGAAAVGAMLDGYDGIELPYTRIITEIGQKPKYVYETNHSLFATIIVASDAFYDSLSPRNKRALEKAIAVAAKVEREDSITYGYAHRADLLDSGTIITPITPSDAAILKERVKPVYEEYGKESGGSELLNMVRSLQ